MTIEVEPAAGEDFSSFPPLPIPGCRFCFEGGLAHLTHYHMAMNPVVTQLVTGHLGHLGHRAVRTLTLIFCLGFPLTKSDFSSFAQRARGSGVATALLCSAHPSSQARAQRCERATSVLDAGFRELAEEK